MGQDLPKKAGEAPTFAVWALKDPDSGNLDRIQIIKGWYDKRGCGFQKIYDVAWSDNRKADAKTGKLPPVGNTVDVTTANIPTISATPCRVPCGRIRTSIRRNTPFTTRA